MKRSLLLTLLVLLTGAAPVLAQIVIPANNYQPAVGTVLRSVNANIDEAFWNSVTSGSGGGHLWDFTSVPFGDLDSSVVVNPATTPAAATFPTANLCIQVVDDDGFTGWNYAESVSDHYQQLGTFAETDSTDYQIVYYDYAPEYLFPLSHGNSWTSYRHSDLSIMGFTTTTADSTFYEVDAYGDVKYGANTLPCLRVKSVERVWSVTTIPGFPPVANLTIEFERYDFITLAIYQAFSVTHYSSPQPSIGASADEPMAEVYSCGASKTALDQLSLVAEFDGSTLPTDFAVEQNYPNPFNPSTSISYALPRPTEVSLQIINVAGQVVKGFEFGSQPAGVHTVTIDMMNDISRNLASGVYFYRINAGELQETRKMMFLK